MTTEIVTVDGEVIEAHAPMTLFGTDIPTVVVERASTVATALAGVIDERRLYATIGQKKHVQVEGWTLLGSMLGVFAEVEWSRPLDNGWEARAVARTLAGNVVGAAEAMCTTGEGRWRSADPYAVRSMAQTRAVSKALRLPLGFIMQLAGYSATPAEELADEQPEQGERGTRRMGVPPARTPAPADQRGPDGRTAEERSLIAELLDIPGMIPARMSLLADAVGVVKGELATADQLREMIALTAIELPEPEPRARVSGGPSAPVVEDETEAGRSDPPPSTSIDTPEAQASEPVAAATEQGVVVPPGDAPAPAPDRPAESQPVVRGSAATAEEHPAGDGVGGRRHPAAPAAPAPTDAEILAVTGGEIVPPKPGTDEYRALPSGNARAKAKAYWDKHPEPVQESLAAALGSPVTE